MAERELIPEVEELDDLIMDLQNKQAMIGFDDEFIPPAYKPRTTKADIEADAMSAEDRLLLAIMSQLEQRDSRKQSMVPILAQIMGQPDVERQMAELERANAEYGDYVNKRTQRSRGNKLAKAELAREARRLREQRGDILYQRGRSSDEDNAAALELFRKAVQGG